LSRIPGNSTILHFLTNRDESYEAGPLITVVYLSFISIYFTTYQNDANYKPGGGEGREQHTQQQGQRQLYVKKTRKLYQYPLSQAISPKYS